MTNLAFQSDFHPLAQCMVAHPWQHACGTTSCTADIISGSHLPPTSYRMQFFADQGCRMVEMTCEEHDMQAASTQFVTHTVGRVLGAMDLESTPINTRGFEALLNLVDNTANDSFELYYGLFLYNQNATGKHFDWRGVASSCCSGHKVVPGPDWSESFLTCDGQLCQMPCCFYHIQLLTFMLLATQMGMVTFVSVALEMKVKCDYGI